jgi:hypothetical protein
MEAKNELLLLVVDAESSPNSSANSLFFAGNFRVLVCVVCVRI